MYANVGELLSDKAKILRDKVFLYYKDVEVSYKELDETSSRLARGLRCIGLKKGDKVCLLLPNMPEFIYAFFGILKLGAVEVPINPLLKPPEIAYIVNNSDAKALITTPTSRQHLEYVLQQAPQLKHIIIAGDSEKKELAFEHLLHLEILPAQPISGDDDAGIIYTSGTTGHPKGVVLSHHNYLANARQLQEGAQIKEADRFCCILPLFHVNAQLVTMLGPLTAGASMILLERFSRRLSCGIWPISKRPHSARFRRSMPS